jgi:glutamate-1-semialdehyde 2,1-aminomutase
MPIQLANSLTPADIALMHQAVDGFVPQVVFDAHAHLWHTRHFAEGTRPAFLPPDTPFGIEAYQKALSRWLPGRVIEGLFFPYPRAGNDRDGENRFLAAELAAHAHMSKSRGLALAAPQDDPGKLRDFILANRLVGLKPYRLYAPFEDTTQVFIEDFAPEWMWKLCDDLDGIMMLHIMRTAGIADEANLRDIRRLCTKYPRCRLVLAHVARSFNYRTSFTGLRRIATLDNVVLDNSAVTEPESMRCALEVLGPRRLLWGSDFMVSELRGKCVTTGDGFSWIYSDELPAQAVTQFENYTLIGIEGLLALREACDATGMNASDVQDIFHDNALRLLAPHLAEEDRLLEPQGLQLWNRAKEKISCGTGLLSKRAHMFDPVSWPAYFSRCKGADIWDLNGRRFTDFTGGVGAILLGHSDDDVNAAVKRRINAGSYCTLASPDEVELAELLLELHPWAERVRYARGGGEALGLAVRIARAASGKSGVAFCGYHGWSDWYLAANLADERSLDGHLLPGLAPLGVPRELRGTAVPFRYNDADSFQRAVTQLGRNFAVVVMEPMRSEAPRDGFLQAVATTCKQQGAVLVMDEVTSGWRFGFPGAAPGLGITPDIAVYAKAMSNGIPAAAIVGSGAVMDAANESFISSSYWTDGIGPAAALACIRKMQRCRAQSYVWHLGERFQQGLRAIATRFAVLKIAIAGQPCAPSLAFQLGDQSIAAKALYIRKMLARGFMVSTQFYVMLAHDEEMVDRVLEHLSEVAEELSVLGELGTLQQEAGELQPQTGFTRLA